MQKGAQHLIGQGTNGEDHDDIGQDGGEQRRDVQIAVAGQDLSQGLQHRIGCFDKTLREGVVEIDAAGLQQKPRNKQKTDDPEEKCDDVKNHIVHGVPNSFASSLERSAAPRRAFLMI